jgi:hypothetical protein
MLGEKSSQLSYTNKALFAVSLVLLKGNQALILRQNQLQ